MFSLASGLYNEYFSPQQVNLLIVGAQGSGKTALMERMKVTDFSATSHSTLSSKTISSRRRGVASTAVALSSGSIRKVPKSIYVFFPEQYAAESRHGHSGHNDTIDEGRNGDHNDNDYDDDDDNDDNYTYNTNNGISTDEDDLTLPLRGGGGGGSHHNKGHHRRRNTRSSRSSNNAGSDDDDNYHGDVSGDDDMFDTTTIGSSNNNHSNEVVRPLLHQNDLPVGPSSSPRRMNRKNLLRGRSNVHTNIVTVNNTLSNSTAATVVSTSSISSSLGIGSITMTVNTPKTADDDNNHNSKNTTDPSSVPGTASKPATTTTSRPWYSNFCPAPRKYKKNDDDDDDVSDGQDYDAVNNSILEHVVDGEQNALLQSTDSNVIENSEFDEDENNNDSFGNDSMESIDFDKSTTTDLTVLTTNTDEPAPAISQRKGKTATNGGANGAGDGGYYTNEKQVGSSKRKNQALQGLENILLLYTREYNLRPNAKMLPLHKINRTIGMNLNKKLSVCSANVHVWDLGGRLSDLWERYYADADAVIFVWKINLLDPELDKYGCSVNTDDDDDKSVSKILSADQQMKLLESVRESVPDDVPFVVFGHIFNPETILPLLPLTTGGSSTEQQKSQLTLEQQLLLRRFYKLVHYCKTDRLYSIAALLPNHPMTNCQGLFFGDASTGKGVKTAIEWIISTAKSQQTVRRQQNQ